MLNVSILVVGPVQTNCYIVHDGQGNCVIIDPGDESDKILSKIGSLGAKPQAILLTHAHFDHIGAVEALQEKYPDVPVYAYEKEKQLMEDPMMNESASMGAFGIRLKGITYLSDRHKLKFLDEEWELISTPGHTVGSCCFFIASAPVLFAGDTLFADGFGRTDLATGSMKDMLHSIREVLMKLPDETMVLPGHGPNTSIGVERKHNFIMRM